MSHESQTGLKLYGELRRTLSFWFFCLSLCPQCWDSRPETPCLFMWWWHWASGSGLPSEPHPQPLPVFYSGLLPLMKPLRALKSFSFPRLVSLKGSFARPICFHMTFFVLFSFFFFFFPLPPSPSFMWQALLIPVTIFTECTFQFRT